jgi:dTDP-4-amino-4,6-dideoxygalactose transaminase
MGYGEAKALAQSKSLTWHTIDVSDSTIPFSRTYVTKNEEAYVLATLRSGASQGDGLMTRAATELVQGLSGSPSALLTTSCTHALELAALLLDIGPGDEVIVPTFTFSSTAAAVAIRGATPVFVDIEPSTANINLAAVAAAITDRTKAIFVVHYGGIPCDIAALTALADAHGIIIVEDNAHGFGARSGNHRLGTVGVLATQSFHATKNIQCGEGGALLINNPQYLERAEIIREKGTNRSLFMRGQVDKYSWVDIGSSYLPSDILAAALRGQLESFAQIQEMRHAVWLQYFSGLGEWAAQEDVRLMQVPADAEHPAHMFYLLMPTHADQRGLLSHLRRLGVTATFHYVPLDSSVAGLKWGRTPEPCPVAQDFSLRQVRLPLFAGMQDLEVERVIEGVITYRVGMAHEIVETA